MIEKDGKNYLQVSDVIKFKSDFSAVPPEILKRKAAIGTRIHKAINEYLYGGFPSFLKVEERGYFHSFIKWWYFLSPTPIQSEMRYYCNEKMLSGQIDALIKVKGEEEAILVDFKTSAQESPSWKYQAHLYHYLICNKRKISKDSIFVMLQKDGSLPICKTYRTVGGNIKAAMRMVDSAWSAISVCKH